MERMEKRGKFAEALDFCDTQLLYCADIYGQKSEQVWQLCERFVATSNALAVAAVQQGSCSQPTKLLRRALAVLRRCITRSDPTKLSVEAIVLNNLGTHYRRNNRLRASESCIEKALRIAPYLEELSHQADTHINMLATKSILGQHSDAAEHAVQAISLLRQEVAQLAQNTSKPELQAEWQQRSGVLAVTIFNHGIELEAMQLDQAALKAFKEASRVCTNCFGHDHPTAVAMQASYHNALSTSSQNLESNRELRNRTSGMSDGILYASSGTPLSFEPSSEAGQSCLALLEEDGFVFYDDGPSDSEHPNAGKEMLSEEDELEELLELMPQYDEHYQKPSSVNV